MRTSIATAGKCGDRPGEPAPRGHVIDSSTTGSAVASAVAAILATSDRTQGERLCDFVVRCMTLDDDIPAPPEGGSPRSDEVFCKHLRAAITDLRLGRLFVWDEAGEHHRALVPRAYDRTTGAVFEAEMKQWREDYRALSPERQMVAATIVWLYQYGPDSTWLRRVPCTWNAAEALHYLRDAGGLRQWMALVSTCPGW